MAQIPTTQTAYFNLPLSVQRLNPRPLDSTSIWNSYEDALQYAKSGATSHVGQLLSVIEETSGVCTTHVYVIKNTDGELKQLDTAETNGDDLSVKGNLTIGGWLKTSGGLYLENGTGEAYISVDTSGTTIVKGATTSSGWLTATHGFTLGENGAVMLESVIDSDNYQYIHCNYDIDIEIGKGIALDKKYVINVKNTNIVSFSAPSRILNLGDNGTTDISLQSDIHNDNNDVLLLSKSGDGNFPNSFTASYNKTNDLIKTYQNSTDAADKGLMILYNLKFGSEKGPHLNTTGDELNFVAPFRYNKVVDGVTTSTNDPKKTYAEYKESDSLYKVLNRVTSTICFTTESDFYEFDKPVESAISIGIAKCKTRIIDGQLFFNDNAYLQAITDGIKYYGNSYFNGNVGSVEFNSGFAGSGWQIAKNGLTGNISGTFDELVIRKKMRVYELEVQKTSLSNGSLWVSDSCSGDTVTAIE